jgi:Lipoprotein LpqB beta-propeller domain/Sporulation and spore germination
VVRRLAGAMLALVIAGSMAGCVSMASGGPVLSYTVTQGPGGQSQHYQQIYAQPPGNGWTPEAIVTGFLTASASFANHQQVAREYMTPQASRAWNPNWSATVFSKGPSATAAVYAGTGTRKTAEVEVTGTVQANLSGSGSYAVPSASAAGGPPGIPPTFDLVKVHGQWRISKAPTTLLLTSDLFKVDYQLRNLYFFDPTGRYLVPDPIYVPLQATPADLMNGLVHDLISPPRDWLQDATRSAFPVGTTRIGDVALDGGTAAVNLGGAIAKASADVMQQVSSQLLWTLSGSGQGGPAVQSVELYLNGKPWIPRGSQENPVQRQSVYQPPIGASRMFYYLDGAGNLLRRDGTAGKPAKVAHVGTGYTQIAVSPHSHYLAALRGGALYIGPVGGKVVKRDGGGYTTISWDPNDNLWATTSDSVVMVRGDARPDQPQGQPVTVTVVDPYGNQASGPFTALRVAPDGVRVAIIVGGTDLNFGAIDWQAGVRAGQVMTRIVLSPFLVAATGTTTFSTVTWYGPDNVITFGEPGPALTEYPVNGGSSTSIPPLPRIKSITASSNSALIAGLAKGGMMADASLTGSWMTIQGNGFSPAYPG